MGLFNRKKEKQATEVTAPRDVLAPSLSAEEPAEAAADQMGTALRAVARKMRATADGQVTLNLTQTGNDMTYTFYQRGNELESGTVLPGGDWFSVIADLYVEEEKGTRGAFNRALIVVSPAVGGEQSVQASFMNAEKSASHNLNYSLSADEVPAAERAEGAAPVATENVPEEADANPMSRVAARLARAEEAGAENTLAREETTGGVTAHAVSGAPAFTQRDSQVSTRTEENGEGYVAQRFASPVEEPEPAAAEETDQSAKPEAVEAVPEETPAETEQPETGESVETGETSSTAETGTDVAGDTEEEREGEAPASEQLPAHLDDEAFTAEPGVPSTPARPAPSAPLDAPTAGANVDVAPSFAAQSYTKPSETTKAEGNLVLSEAEVVSRFSPVYDALFGKNGTALDVSTVLIRVRSLGSYYDALTHVRRNGFWEQVRTFDLVPEETLAILQLKADSYKEGHGSPLAINIRFTPGVPAAVAFDYADEEAFISYPERLPAQQYVEELRMFPRTGANIPAHMNEALASWTF